MSDRKLLELAAKAAGIEGELTEYGVWLKGGGVWRPHTDDGDALRLAVKLGLDVSVSKKHKDTMASYFLKKDVAGAIFQKWDNDSLAATRRAIVRAAAEIGRNMT